MFMVSRGGVAGGQSCSPNSKQISLENITHPTPFEHVVWRTCPTPPTWNRWLEDNAPPTPQKGDL